VEFKYEPSKHVPFRDQAVLERVRAIRTEDLTKHPNPDYRIRILDDGDVTWNFVTDMLGRIKQSADERKPIVMIIPQPWPLYANVAQLINRLNIDCSRLYTFNMDEYANEDGVIAPETWQRGFGYALKKFFYSQIDPKLRPPEKQMVGLTNKNINDYAKMMEDAGGVDICYSGPGWTGHLAFIEPDAPEFSAGLEEWKKMGPRIVTLSPFTLAQNSLHGSFGLSGDIALVPPKAATIGPAQVIAARHRIQTIGISVQNTVSSWQRLIGRLVMHGPVTPLVPESICQTLRTDVVVSKTVAMNIESTWALGY